LPLLAKELVSHLRRLVLQVHFTGEEIKHRQLVKSAARQLRFGSKLGNCHQGLQVQATQACELCILTDVRRPIHPSAVIQTYEKQEVPSHVVISNMGVGNINGICDNWNSEQRTLTQNQLRDDLTTIERRLLPCSPETAKKPRWWQKEKLQPFEKAMHQWR
jgi:hypothetical protein